MASDANLDTLQRVANALGIPVSAFFDQPSRSEISPAAQAAQESSELLRLFARIADPQARRDCIEFVQEKTACSSQPKRIFFRAD